MKNPYETLGVKENATKDEIKKAYRELVKQYHPDQYGNNPLRDLAEDKMRDINEAYDTLIKGGNDTYYQSTNNDSSDNSSSHSNSYTDIRRDLQRGDITSAEKKLNSINVRNAEWNFLMGMVHLRKGWYDGANNYLSNACSLDPGNREYREVFQQMNNRNRGYRQTYNQRGGNDMCDICFKLWCLDSICECFGGDIISCC